MQINQAKLARIVREISQEPLVIKAFYTEGDESKTHDIIVNVTAKNLKYFAIDWLRFVEEVGTTMAHSHRVFTRKAGMCMNLGMWLLADQLGIHTEDRDLMGDYTGTSVIHAEIDGINMTVHPSSVSWDTGNAINKLFTARAGNDEYVHHDIYPFNTGSNQYHNECESRSTHKNEDRNKFVEALLSCTDGMKLTPEIAEVWDAIMGEGVEVQLDRNNPNVSVIATKQSLKTFAREYLAWVEADCPHDNKHFTKSAGLCLNLAAWDVRAYTPVEIATSYLIIPSDLDIRPDVSCSSMAYLADMMTAWVGYPVSIHDAPFNTHVMNYHGEKEALSIHLNKGRMEFVRALVQWV